VDVDAEQVWLEVKDNGWGISQDRLRAVESGSGTGVGLAGMRERVGELGGSLTIESSQTGTLLRIFIPIVENIEEPSAGDDNPTRGPSTA
jgi:signal transduction histidine kinase